jgi:hypothetical protein
MATYRLQVQWGADSALPRDRFVITPHFRNNGGPLTDDDVGGLADDLATALSTWATPADGREVIVKAYNAEQPRGNFPLATAVRNANAYPLSSLPREIACCLSYYSGRNVPRSRGRLYIPKAVYSTGSTIRPRPEPGDQTYVAQLAGIFANLGGPDVDWVVWSRADHAAKPVTHWWIDDEWDVQRRRGLRSTTRMLGTTTEAGTPITP